MAQKVGMQLSLDGEREYKSALKEIVQETKTLNAQMKEVSSAFDDEASSLEANQKQTELLTRKKENLERQIELMTDRLEALRDSEEDTTMAESRLEEQIAKVETQLNNTNSELQAHQDAIDELQSPMGELEQTIADQVSELEELKEAYVNAYLEFGSTSDEAEDLANRISDLSAELSENQAAMDEAKGAADGFDQSMGGIKGGADEVGGVIGGLADKFGLDFGRIKDIVAGGGILDGLGFIKDAIADVMANVGEMAAAWETAGDTITFATGATGEALEGLKNATEGAYGETRNMDASLQDMSAISGQVATKFVDVANASGDFDGTVQDLTTRISEYAYATGVDGVGATNDLYNISKRWGDEAGSITDITDKLTKATQDSGVQAGELHSILLRGSAAFENVGMGFDQAVGFIDAYSQAGGSASDITRMLNVASRNLAKEGVTDIPGTFEKAIETISQFDNTADAMNATIEGTDLTIRDVFGNNANMQNMIKPFTDGKIEIERWTDSIRDSSGTLDEVMNSNTSNMDKWQKELNKLYSDTGRDAHDFADAMVGYFLTNENAHGQYVDQTKNFNAEVMRSVREAGGTMQEAVDAARAAAQEDMSQVEQSADSMAQTWGKDSGEIEGTVPDVNVNTNPAQGGMSSLSSFVSAAFQKMQGDAASSGSSIEGTMNQTQQSSSSQMGLMSQAMARLGEDWRNKTTMMTGTKPKLSIDDSGARGGLSSLTSFFHSKIAEMRANSVVNVVAHGSLPIITAVKDAIGGISYSISGYRSFAEGYNRAMLINSPTIFGTSNGTSLIAGDRAGAEVVVGESHLLNMFTLAVERALGYIPSGGTSNTNYYGGVNVNVYGAPGQDVKELANLVSKEINRAVNMRSAI